jgi:hypothetical protein
VAVVLPTAAIAIVQYLRARGELPVLDALLRSGTRAVLESDPPLTAAALESIVCDRPVRPRSLGSLPARTELPGSPDQQPFDAPECARGAGLAWWAPAISAANLLFRAGGCTCGRHSEVTGPRARGGRCPRRQRAISTRRPRWLSLAAVRGAIGHLRTIAARALVSARETDLALRVEALDILTHAHFADAVPRPGRQGQAASTCAVIWMRAWSHAELDADDLLVVMSDHGIRTAMGTTVRSSS